MIPRVEVRGLSKSFGAVRALDHVAVTFSPGSLHAVIGENGAGKSTLVKCMMGYHHADAGEIVIDAAPRVIDNPRQAHALGLGLVYQHFTLVPHMTVAENLVLGRGDLPAIIDWKAERRRIDAFQQQMPFALDPDAPVSVLASGEKQKLEILKQLYLGCRFLMLDEPTSVLTPDEADQVLGTLQRMTKAGVLTVVLITHKIREVLRFADRVTVLRDGRNVGEGEKLGREELERLMGVPPYRPRHAQWRCPVRFLLDARQLCAVGDRGAPALSGVSFAVRAGEILGIAGVSGNGQRELVEVLAGQRQRETGEVRVAGSPYRATREELRVRGVHVLPEEPLRNACVQTMSVSENLALRIFDVPPNAVAGFVRRRALAPCRSSDPTLRHPRTRDGCAARNAFWRQRSARGAGARIIRAGVVAHRADSMLRTRSRCNPRDTRPDHSRAQSRRRGAAHQRGFGRALGTGRSHRRDV
jgi:ABC-type uncharacterized transport system ATPase subunit